MSQATLLMRTGSALGSGSCSLVAKREAMIVTCLRCLSSYDMDYEESWPDHHMAPIIGECAPEPEKCTWAQDARGPYCTADHSEDWKLTLEMVDE